MKPLILLIAILFPLTTIDAQETQYTPADSSSIKKETQSFEKAIAILNFEKQLSSKAESLIIQNRTGETVTRIKLRLTYKTPKGEMLDYRDVTIDGEILPGMTKKFSIDSFDQNRQYYYFATAPTGKSIESSYPFKVSFTLLRYDIAIYP